MSTISTRKSSTSENPLREKPSRETHSFVDFIFAARVKASPRGDLIALYRTLINARALPRIASWSDLYRFMMVRRSPAETIDTARALWREYQKSQTAVPPATTRRADHG
jgi:hypothetical protein